MLSNSFNILFSPEEQNPMAMIVNKYLQHQPKTIYFQENKDDLEEGKKRLTRRPKTSHSSMHAPLEIYLDGPHGAPSSGVFYRVDHAVMVATGIGVTPFASILQSIMYKFWEARRTCPNCEHSWSEGLHTTTDFSLKKVDFIWINREQRAFEWFLQLLSQLEMEQAEFMRNKSSQGQGGNHDENFLDIHLYITSFSATKNMNAVALKLALDLMHTKVSNISDLLNVDYSFALELEFSIDQYKKIINLFVKSNT